MYEAEKFVANERFFHRSCATCKSCAHKIDSTNLSCGPDGEIYCEACYSREFGGSAGYRGSLGKRLIDASSAAHFRPCQNVDTRSVPAENEESACRKCSGKVYALERISSKAGNWHKQCFNCNGCGATLTSTLTSAFGGQDGEVYCKACFGKTFGDATAAKPMTHWDTKSIRASSGERGCPRCGGAVFEAEKVVAGESVWFHKACFDCRNCHTKLDIMRAAIGSDGDAFCESCHRAAADAERARARSMPRSRHASASGVVNVDAGSCPRCGDKVFEAEKMTSGGRLYHQACFTCRECGHRLDYSNCVESSFTFKGVVFVAEAKAVEAGPTAAKAAAAADVYCKTCHVRAFFTGGRNKFGDATSLPPPSGAGGETGTKGCIKCRQQVFEVDKIVSRHGLVHKQCLTCGMCKRTLNSSTFCDGASDVYCKPCYTDSFGVVGRKSAATVENKIMAGEGDESRCPRCAGKVFEAERMKTSAGSFHPACFRCAKCATTLDYSKVFCSEGDVYCGPCYKEDFGVTSRRARPRSR